MLEQFYKDPATVQRRRAGLLGPHLDSFIEVVSDLGYSRLRIFVRLRLLGDLERWLQRNAFGVNDLKEEVVDRFLKERRRTKKSRAMGDPLSLRQFLDHLRQRGTVREAESTIDQSPLAALERRYEEYLRKERGLSPLTPGRYWVFLRHFLLERFGNGPIQLHELAPADISGFLLRHARSSTPGVARLMVSALRSFFRFLFRYGETGSDLSRAVLTVATWRLAEVPKYLNPDEVERVVETCDRNTALGRRNRAVILLLARLGFRAGEVVSLELDDIDWRAGEITVRGKGQFHDRLPLPPDVGEALAAYLRQDRPKCSTRRVFLRMRAPFRGFLGPSTVCTIVCRAVKRAGLEPPTMGAHLFRHSLATGMLRRGATMGEVGEILRHRSPNTTEIYAKVDIEGLRTLAKPWPTTEVSDG